MSWGLVHERKRAGVKLLGISLIFGVLASTIWFDRFSPWRVIFECCPGAQAVRAVTRIGLLLLIPVAVGVACALQQMTRKYRWIALLLGLLCLAEQGITTPSFDRAQVQAQVDAIVRRIDPGCQAFYVTQRGTSRRFDLLNLTAMDAQLASGIPTVNGYSGWVPQGQERLYASIYSSDDAETAIEAALQSWAAQHHLRREAICWIRLEPEPPSSTNPTHSAP